MKTRFARISAVILLGAPAIFTCAQTPPMVSFHLRFAEGAVVAEKFGGSQAVIEIVRSGDPNPVVVVDVGLKPGGGPADTKSATPGIDCALANERVELAGGENTKSIVLEILDDGDVEEVEFITVNLSARSVDRPVGGGSFTFSILDNEIPATVDVTRPVFDGEPFVLIDGKHSLLPLPEKMWLAVGDFSHVNGSPRNGVARLTSDYELDESFVPPSDMPKTFDGHPLEYLHVPRVLVQKTGFLILSAKEGSLTRLNSDGSRDPTFQPAFPSGHSNINQDADESVWCVRSNQVLHLAGNGTLISSRSVPAVLAGQTIVGIQSGGRLLAAQEVDEDHDLGWFTVSWIRRWFLDGTLDSSFRALRLPHRSSWHWVSAPFAQLPDGRLVAQRQWPYGLAGNDPESSITQVMVFNADGIPDPTFPPARTGDGEFADIGFSENRLQRYDKFSPGFFEMSDDVHLGAAPKTSLGIFSAGIRGPKQSPYWVTSFRRLGSTREAARIRFTTRDATAVAGVDYEHRSGTLVFSPLEVEKVVEIPILARPNPGDWARHFEIVVDESEGIEVLPEVERVFTTNDGQRAFPHLDRVKRLRDGRTLIQGFGQGGLIEYSADLKPWKPVPGLLEQPGRFGSYRSVWTWLDASATNAPTRYYRAMAR